MIRPRELALDVQLFSSRTPTLPPATHTNSYALGARDVVLVEPATPYAGEQREWLAWARGLPSQGRRVVALFATHHHADHVGGLDVFARELGVDVWAHAETANRVGRDRFRRTLEDGEVLDLGGPIPSRWTVLHTPGHAPGHACLWNEGSGTVVVGDMVAAVGTILIAPGDGDMILYLEQLERLAGLDARLALPAHGNPIDEPTRLFRHYVIHRNLREAKILASVSRAPPEGATPIELLPDAYGDTGKHLWSIALLSLRSHLEKLRRDGKVFQRDDRFLMADAARPAPTSISETASRLRGEPGPG